MLDIEYDRRWERIEELLVQGFNDWPEEDRPQTPKIRADLFATRVLKLLRAECGKDIKIGWGHIYDGASNKIEVHECDIIVFRGDPVFESDFIKESDFKSLRSSDFLWRHPVLNVCLVEKLSVVLIIECKYCIKLDPKNSNELRDQQKIKKQYIERKKIADCDVWLVAEKVLVKDECEIQKVKDIVEAKGIADKFYNFYNDTGGHPEYNKTGWDEFIDKVAKIR